MLELLKQLQSCKYGKPPWHALHHQAAHKDSLTAESVRYHVFDTVYQPRPSVKMPGHVKLWLHAYALVEAHML